MSELWRRSALELAALIRTGEVSSRQVVAAHLDRIDAVNPHLNAIVHRLDDAALAAADGADAARAAGEVLGTWHGVPITVKENIDLAGTPTTQGMPAFADAFADRDAPTVARMRAAGAIPIARTNMPDAGLRIHTDSSLHGLTRNPWNPSVTAGGSSGGEASAIAAGMSPLGLGNDIGGSLRNPAHCCGIASIRPTTGVVPIASVVPPHQTPLASQLMLAEGPMARRVADLAATLVTLAGWSPRDPRSVPAMLTALGDGERLRVGVLAEPPGGAVHPEIAAAVRHAGELLADVGHEVVEACPPGYEDVVSVWNELLVGDLAAMREWLGAVMPADAVAELSAMLAAAPPPELGSVAALLWRRFQHATAWSQFFATTPVLLSPTWALPAFAHGADRDRSVPSQVITDTLRPVLPANALGLPAAVVPCGMAAGLPVGVQVIGERFTDLRVLGIAAQIEAAVAPLTPIDPVRS